MPIKLTAGGKVILKNGKPSCECCGCAEQTSVCITFYDTESEELTLTGSLNGGLFEGTTAQTCHPVSLEWNGAAWELYYNSVLMDTGGDDPCNPVGLVFHYEDEVITVDATVNGFGPCPVCDPNQTEVCVRLYYWDGAEDQWEDLTLIGDLNAGSFTDGTTTLTWEVDDPGYPCSPQWILTTSIPGLTIDTFTGNTTRCNPIGAIFSDSTPGPPPTTFEVVGWGACTVCSPDETDLCVRYRDYPDFIWEYHTLSGSLVEGLFSGTIDGKAISVYWDGYEWQSSGPGSAAVYSVVVTRCNATEYFGVYDEYTEDQWEIEVMGFGTDCCPCPTVPDTLTIEVYNLDNDLQESGSAALENALCPPVSYTTAVAQGYLYWIGNEWVFLYDTLLYGGTGEAFNLTPTDQCDPTGTYDNGAGYTFVITAP